MNIARSVGYTKEAYEFEAYSIEIITTKQFRDDTFISQRGCRFHSESNLTHYKVYSKLLCLSECRVNLAMKVCGCIPYFYPNKSKLTQLNSFSEFNFVSIVKSPKPICSYQKLMSCFPSRKELFLEFHDASDGRDEMIQCNCLQNCLESNVSFCFKLL